MANANATLYLCARCKASGERVEAVSRPRIDGKNVALCAMHLDRLQAGKSVTRAVKRGEKPEAIHAAAAAVYDTAWREEVTRQAVLCAETRAMNYRGQGRNTLQREEQREAGTIVLARMIEQRAAVMYPRPPVEACWASLAEMNSQAILVGAHGNNTDTRDIRLDAPILGDEESTTLSNVTERPAASTDPDGWDPEILAMLDPIDAAMLEAWAERPMPDGAEPTRNDASAWTTGRCVPTGVAPDSVRRAALAYLTARAARNAYEIAA